jgi:hypothetical protein
VLSKIYKQAGFKEKAVIINRAPNRKTVRLDEFDERTLSLYRYMKWIRQPNSDGSRKRLMFLDECVFTARGFKMRAWSGPGENIHVEDRLGKQPCLAVCGVVDETGLVCHGIEEYSYDAVKYAAFLEQIRATDGVGDEKIYLFVDNSSVHKERTLVIPKYKELNIVPVWNLPYAPQYN